MDLSRLRGKNRLPSIFAPSASDEGAERQRDLPEGHEEVGLADRDPLALRLFEDGSGDAAGERPVTPEEAGTARDDFGVEDGRFAAVLVGKDGTARLGSGAPVTAPDLFARVDAMPMRRREVRAKDRPGVRPRG